MAARSDRSIANRSAARGLIASEPWSWDSERLVGTALLPSETTIANDGEEPRPGVATAIPVEMAKCTQCGVLYRILGIVLIPKQITGERVPRIQMR